MTVADAAAASRSHAVRVACGALVLVVAATVIANGVEPSSTALDEPVERVVVFGISPMGFDDLKAGVTPTIDRLIDDGALAAASVRAIARSPTTSEGWLSFGAGARAARTSTSDVAYDADEPIASMTAREVVATLSGREPDGTVVVPGGPAVVKLNDTPRVPSPPGALGAALNAAGLTTAVIGNADEPSGLGLPGRSARRSSPAATALMDETFAVDGGTVDADLLMADPSAPFGFRSDPGRVMAEFTEAYAVADVVVVDPGDLDRAEAIRGVATESAARQARRDALERTDAILAAVLDTIDERTRVIVVSLAAPAGRFELTPVVLTGAGVPHGWLHSPSTRRPGLVTLTDLAPTVLESLGIEVPGDMIGNALRVRGGEVSLAPLQDYNRDTLYRERTYYPQAVAFIVSLALLYAFAVLVLHVGHESGRARRLLRYLILVSAAFPLATFVVKAVPDFSSLGSAGPPVTMLVAFVIGALASRSRRTPLSSLKWILGLTAAAIVVDTATGTWLHVSSWLGYSLHSAGRFYGIPNTTFAVLAACTLLWAGAHVEYAHRRRDAVITVLAVFAVVVYVDGAPFLGGDVGGILTLVPVFGLMGVYLFRGRIDLGYVMLAGLATLALLALAAGLDLTRPDEARTHLGRFAAAVLDEGVAPITESFLRKQGANLRILSVSIWAWTIPIAVGFLTYVLGVDRRVRTILESRSALRIAVIATGGAALLGFATNDSGPIVLGLFFAYLGPFLTLLALESEAERDVESLTGRHEMTRNC